MEFKQNEWVGSWTNFESYIYSEEEAMKLCWEEAEKVAGVIPMFKNGAKAFWKVACNTISEECAVRLGGWNISESGNGIIIEWIDAEGKTLGKYRYEVKEVIEKGLEAKENFLFEAKEAPEKCAFRYLLAMEPMPEKTAKLHGGLLSHLHFQYASSLEKLFKEGRLRQPMWYATMCDGEGDLLEQCNIVRALHRMQKWESLPSMEIDFHEIVECIASALDAKDPYTAGHSRRVSDMALVVCRLMGLKEHDTEKIHIAGHLHDIGKIGVPDAVLNKEGKLADEEFAYIKKHPQIGAEILNKSHRLREISDIVLMHHERYDGKGYPIGAQGVEIPVGARILAICDSIDAMTSSRCYRRALSFEICYDEIEKNLGKMYDPIIGRYVLDNWEEIISVVKIEKD